MAVNNNYLSRFGLVKDLRKADAGTINPDPFVRERAGSNFLSGSEEPVPTGIGPKEPNSSSPSDGNTEELAWDVSFEVCIELETSNRVVFLHTFPLKTGRCNCRGGSLPPFSSELPSWVVSAQPLLCCRDKWLAQSWFVPLPGDCRSLYT